MAFTPEQARSNARPSCANWYYRPRRGRTLGRWSRGRRSSSKAKYVIGRSPRTRHLFDDATAPTARRLQAGGRAEVEDWQPRRYLPNWKRIESAGRLNDGDELVSVSTGRPFSADDDGSDIPDRRRPAHDRRGLRALKEEFLDISISKIRYLEGEGLVTPERTRGGYRLFGAEEEVERLETILRLQRDEFLPLKVIREELEKPTSPSGAPARPRAPGHRCRARPGTLCDRAGIDRRRRASLEEQRPARAAVSTRRAGQQRDRRRDRGDLRPVGGSHRPATAHVPARCDARRGARSGDRARPPPRNRERRQQGHARPAGARRSSAGALATSFWRGLAALFS